MSHAIGPPKMDRSWWRVLTNVVHWRREWQTTSIFLPWEPHKQYEKAKRQDTERWTPQVDAQYATGDQWKNNSRKNEVQFSSVAQSCPTLCDPMNRSTSGFPVHHQLPEFIQTHVHQVGNAIQLSHPLSSLSPPSPNSSQHQSLFQWINSSHEVAKVLEFQL